MVLIFLLLKNVIIVIWFNHMFFNGRGNNNKTTLRSMLKVGAMGSNHYKTMVGAMGSNHSKVMVVGAMGPNPF